MPDDKPAGAHDLVWQIVMLPSLERLRLTPTGEFWRLSAPQAQELNGGVNGDGVETFTQEPFPRLRGRNDPGATFRVRGMTPLADGTYAYTYYDAHGLWEYVKEEGRAKVPLTQEPIWREDWWALRDRFAPGSSVPFWVRNLPQLDPSRTDTRIYGTYGIDDQDVPQWRADLRDVTVNIGHVETTGSNLRQFRQAVDRVEQGMVEDDDYRNEIVEGHPTANLGTMVEELCGLISQPLAQNIPWEATGRAIEFLGKFGWDPAVYRELREYPELGATLTRLLEATDFYAGAPSRARWYNIKRLMHYLMWTKPIENFQLTEAVPLPRTGTRDHTADEEAGLGDLTRAFDGLERLFLTSFAQDPEGFVHVGDYAWPDEIRRKENFERGLQQLDALYVATTDYPADGRKLAVTKRLFMAAIDVFIGIDKWRMDESVDAHEYERYGEEVDALSERVLVSARIAVQYTMVVPQNRTIQPTAENLMTFFWKHIAPIYAVAHTAETREQVEMALFGSMVPFWEEPPTPSAGDDVAGPPQRRQRTGACYR